ncbi:hypothetical protein PROFUN_12887 [Planoprotostelium fungivorum]|uniref:Uncharacterized protein n=1 Tax=Planoprotostelium fungivorum TaxID=1890364 RepID=A0A2P6MWI1_9EUKA|nr:hypothetical protein PROFUN_12887 [Planoprotostelium fungivorum]
MHEGCAVALGCVLTGGCVVYICCQPQHYMIYTTSFHKACSNSAHVSLVSTKKDAKDRSHSQRQPRTKSTLFIGFQSRQRIDQWGTPVVNQRMFWVGMVDGHRGIAAAVVLFPTLLTGAAFFTDTFLFETYMQLLLYVLSRRDNVIGEGIVISNALSSDFKNLVRMSSIIMSGADSWIRGGVE